MAYYRVGHGGQTFWLAVKIVVMMRPLGLKLLEAVCKYLWMSAILSWWEVVQALGYVDRGVGGGGVVAEELEGDERGGGGGDRHHRPHHHLHQVDVLLVL